MKKILVSILTLIFIVSMITTIYAATGNISLSASSDTVLKGKTFTVTIAGTADNNITAMQGNLTYDSNKLSIQSKSAGTGFSDLSGSNEIAVTSTNSENLSKAATLYTITFKVSDTAEVGETTISVKDAVLALVNEQSVQENTEKSSDEVTITIKADDTTVGSDKENTNTNTNTNANTNTNTGSNNSSNSSNSSNKYTNTTSTTKKNTTNKTTKLPQTGVESASVVAIVALGVISIVSYVSYRKYKDI